MFHVEFLLFSFVPVRRMNSGWRKAMELVSMTVRVFGKYLWPKHTSDLTTSEWVFECVCVGTCVCGRTLARVVNTSILQQRISMLEF